MGSAPTYNNNVAATLIGLHQSVASGIRKCGHVWNWMWIWMRMWIWYRYRGQRNCYGPVQVNVRPSSLCLSISHVYEYVVYAFSSGRAFFFKLLWWLENNTEL